MNQTREKNYTSISLDNIYGPTSYFGNVHKGLRPPAHKFSIFVTFNLFQCLLNFIFINFIFK